MAAVKNDKGIIYKCPICFNNLIDVVVDLYDDGKYHCVKCGYAGTKEDLLARYDQFRTRYKLYDRRLTLEDQKMM